MNSYGAIITEVLRLLLTLGSDPSSKEGVVWSGYGWSTPHDVKTSESTRKGRFHKVVNNEVVYSSTDRARINTITHVSDCKGHTVEQSKARQWANLRKQHISGRNARV